MDEYPRGFDSTKFQSMNIRVSFIPIPGMLLHTLFLTFVSLHLPRHNYESLNAASDINQDGRVVTVLDSSSNG